MMTNQAFGAVSTRLLRSTPGLRRDPSDRPARMQRDPVCQSFAIDMEDGLYVSSIDLFFATKSSVEPVTLQIRTMQNGYPTSEVLPFGQVNVPSGSINTSSDASVATTFTFPSPVFLSNNTEYAFCALANTLDFTIYTSVMGQTTLDGTRLISQQPYLGSMFKSQNSTTWTAEQNEDVKFTVKRAKFAYRYSWYCTTS